jgi:hypothetical protein
VLPASVGTNTVTALSTPTAKAAGILSATSSGTSVTVTYAYNGSNSDGIASETADPFGTEVISSLTASNDSLSGGDGDDTIFAGTGSDTVSGGDGDDVIRLGSGSTDSTVVMFASSGSGNDNDTISTFKAGALASGGDVFNFDAFLPAGATVKNTLSSGVYVKSSTTALATEGTSIGLSNQILIGEIATNLTGVDTVGEIVTALADGGVLDAVDVAASAKAVLMLAVDGGTSMLVYFVNNDSTAAVIASEVTLVGTVTTSTDAIDLLVAANIDPGI